MAPNMQPGINYPVGCEPLHPGINQLNITPHPDIHKFDYGYGGPPPKADPYYYSSHSLDGRETHLDRSGLVDVTKTKALDGTQIPWDQSGLIALSNREEKAHDFVLRTIKPFVPVVPVVDVKPYVLPKVDLVPDSVKRLIKASTYREPVYSEPPKKPLYEVIQERMDREKKEREETELYMQSLVPKTKPSNFWQKPLVKDHGFMSGFRDDNGAHTTTFDDDTRRSHFTAPAIGLHDDRLTTRTKLHKFNSMGELEQRTTVYELSHSSSSSSRETTTGYIKRRSIGGMVVDALAAPFKDIFG